MYRKRKRKTIRKKGQNIATVNFLASKQKNESIYN